ncbi:MAG TPA: AAA family ATPase, partial [Pseudothermotoga sp.]
MNPWWQRAQEIYIDRHIVSYEKSVFKYYPKKLFKAISPEKPGIYTLRGPRQIGKTTFLKLYIKNLIENQTNTTNIFFLTCDGLK